jgi:hypothetical protein
MDGHAYRPAALAQAVDSLDDQPLGYRVNIFLSRLCFRGIYFPMMGRRGVGEGDCAKPANHPRTGLGSVAGTQDPRWKP